MIRVGKLITLLLIYGLGQRWPEPGMPKYEVIFAQALSALIVIYYSEAGSEDGKGDASASVKT